MQMKMEEFARTMHVSRSTIIRFIKVLGLEGGKQLKIELHQYLEKSKNLRTQMDANLPFDEEDDGETIAEN